MTEYYNQTNKEKHLKNDRLKSAVNNAARPNLPQNYHDNMTISDTVSVLTKTSAISRVSQVGGGDKSKDKLKVCMRIWSGFTKFIRS